MQKMLLISSFEDDLNDAVRWLHANRSLADLGEISKRGDYFICPIRTKKSLSDIASLLNLKFKRFVQVKKL
jgi:hypothetical protein